jgi:toxin YoeB
MGQSQGTDYRLIFSDTSLIDLAHHYKAGDNATIKRIDRILMELASTPFTGIGNPHMLKHDYSGFCARHLNKKDVIVYLVDENQKTVNIHSARYHYSDK